MMESHISILAKLVIPCSRNMNLHVMTIKGINWKVIATTWAFQQKFLHLRDSSILRLTKKYQNLSFTIFGLNSLMTLTVASSSHGSVTALNFLLFQSISAYFAPLMSLPLLLPSTSETAPFETLQCEPCTRPQSHVGFCRYNVCSAYMNSMNKYNV